MNRTILALAGVLLLAFPSLPARAATWSIDPGKSTLGFSGTQTGESFKGRFSRWTATIDFDPAHPEAARVMAEVDVASATTGDPQKDEAMPGSDWFDAKGFAKARFEASGFTPKGGDAYEAAGTLTLRGVSKPVLLPFTLKIEGDTAHAAGQAKLVRTDFGVGAGQWADGSMVGLDVAVNVDLTATRR